MADINVSYQWAINTCNSTNVGYNQYYRNQQTVNGITYYDCSSFIWYSLLAGGFDVVGAFQTATGYAYSGNAITTGYMAAWLTALGFKEVPLSGEWKAGDIGLVHNSRHQHTEMVYSGGTGQGVCMGAHSSSSGVNISPNVSYADRWGSLWRYGEGGAEGYGLSIYVISAICGNWWQESGINPGVYESLKVVDLKDNNVYGGYGLGQWTNVPDSSTHRRTNLANWLDDNGYEYDDPVGQIEFLMDENVWLSGKTYSKNFTDLNDFLNSTSTDLDLLTRAFLDGWEGVYSSSQATLRIANAEKVMAYINAHAQDTSITEWYIGNRYLTDDERLNNAVMLYRYLSTGGGGGKDSEAVHNMPVWMMTIGFW